MGGLGNQLQQYALYQKFISMGKEALLDVSWFESATQADVLAARRLELDCFENADYVSATPEQIGSVLGNQSAFAKLARKMHVMPKTIFSETGQFHPEIFGMEDVYLQGYWATEKYYADILPLLREKLSFTHIDDANRMMAAQIAQAACSGVKTCSVHIRRSDYLDPANALTFGGIATESYYDAAFSLVQERYPETEFYIFSDDQEYVQARYGSNAKCHIVDINHDKNNRYDIYLMSQCDFHICANSTFSFWGARLDDKRLICIRPTIHKNSQSFDYEEMKDLWKGWIFISPEGEVFAN